MYNIEKIHQCEAELSNESLEELLYEFGSQKVGRYYFCAFHDEDTPSLSANEESGVWRCFSCGRGGGTAKLIYEYYKMTYGIELYYDALEKYLSEHPDLIARLGFDSMKDDYFLNQTLDRKSVIDRVKSVERFSHKLEYTKINLIENRSNDIDDIIKEMYLLQTSI